MRVFPVALLLSFIAGSAVAAQPSYLNSRGQLVKLTPAPELLARQSGVQPGGAVFVVPDSDKVFALNRGVIVKLQQAGLLQGVLDSSGLELVEQLGRDGTRFLCRAENAQAALAATVELGGLPGIEWALPDFLIPFELYHQPNDPYYQYQWHHYQASGGHIGSQDAWDTTLGDSQVVVAIIDTGVDLTHPDLDPARMVTGYNAQDDSSNPTPLGSCIDAHGTCCSGEIIASADNGEGAAGVCPGCSWMPIKMMDGDASMEEISVGYKAIEYATANGAWVISNSWGIDQMYLDQVDIQPFIDAIQDAVTNGRGGMGAVVLFASGNGSMFTGQGEPIGTGELQNMPEVMAVGGSGPDDQRVMYSDYGPNLSVVAPTGSIQMDPNNMFDGPQIFTCDTTGEQGFSRSGKYWMPGLWGEQETAFEEVDATGNYTSYFNGTSAACPVAAGVVALVFSANSNLSGADARRIVEGTADKVGDDASYDAEGHDEKYGFGRVSAIRAVRAAPYGVDNPDGSLCAEDVNCLNLCGKLNPDDPEGICAEICETDSDCGDGRTCTSMPSGLMICLPACDTDADCDGEALCVDGACMVIACQDGNECPEGTACPPGGGNCQPACTSDDACLEPELCLEAGGGSLCQAVACTDGSECPDDTACPSGGGYCQRACLEDLDCPSPALCLPAGSGSLCQELACSTDSDCPPQLECGPDGFCQRAEAADGGPVDGGDTDGGNNGNGGNGGCGCASERGAGPVGLLLVLAWVFLIRRRT